MSDKILIVDDDIDTLKLVGLMLERQGYNIVVASNGKLGISKATEEKPDLILLDVMLPGVDGTTICREIRTFSDVAIILSLIHISEPTRPAPLSRMPSSA